SGMLPGHLAGHYRFDEIHVDLVRLANAAGARFIAGSAVGLERAERRVLLDTGRAIAYDTISLNLGSTSQVPGLPGSDWVVPIKPLSGFLDAFDAVHAAVAAGEKIAPLVMIGGGVGGVESAMAIAHRLRDVAAQSGAPLPSPLIHVIERAAQVLPTLSAGVRSHVLAACRALDVALISGVGVTGASEGAVTLANGTTLASALTISAAGANAPDWLSDTGLALTDRGFIRVGATLASVSDDSVFAAGDIAHMDHEPREKAGVFAVRQAKPLEANLRRRVAGTKLTAFTPQRDYLKLISLGARRAVGVKLGAVLVGGQLWRWKDRIDRAFMDQFTALTPGMAAAHIAQPDQSSSIARLVGRRLGGGAPAGQTKGDSAPAMLCAGCGAKVGQDVLAHALSEGAPGSGTDGRSLIGDDAAVLTVPAGMEQVISHDHLRAMTADERLMTRIAVAHALSDIHAMNAAPQAGLLAVTLPEMHPVLQARTLREIVTTARGALEAAGATLAGGHTTQGCEFTIGFTVTGLVEPGARKSVRGAQVGDTLILTKRLGTGTVIAAHGAGRADGRLVSSTFERMAAGNGAAAGVLRAAPWSDAVHALTDVTGFGVAGHLATMLSARPGEPALRARLEMEDVPLPDAVANLIDEGVRSSLHDSNARALTALTFTDEGVHGLTQNPKFVALAEPQTCGGLLISVAPDQAPGLLAALHAAGETDACVIGSVEAAT
ncbi:MAG: selenide, water dikinase SelD, partial [Pseudomonadota bacterium]